jgi:hypothetical protein
LLGGIKSGWIKIKEGVGDGQDVRWLELAHNFSHVMGFCISNAASSG